MDERTRLHSPHLWLGNSIVQTCEINVLLTYSLYGRGLCSVFWSTWLGCLEAGICVEQEANYEPAVQQCIAMPGIWLSAVAGEQALRQGSQARLLDRPAPAVCNGLRAVFEIRDLSKQGGIFSKERH